MMTPKATAGYSFIELLVVIVIVGILATAGIYYRMDRNGPAVKGAMVAIAGALTDARSMSRGAGQNVTLVPSGSGKNIVLTYQITGGPQGQYSHAVDTSSARFCLVDADGSSDPTNSAIGSLKTALEATKAGGTTIFSSAVWTTNLFDAGSGVIFYPNGTVNKEAYVAVVGTTNGTAISNGPIGIVLVNASGNLYRYYRSSSTSKWMRL